MTIPTLGPTRVPQEIAIAWAQQKGAHERFTDILIPLYYETAPAYDLPAENAIVQSYHETGGGHFGGVVSPDHHNPAGIKTAAGGGNNDPQAHMRFETWRDGVQAHCSHLATYGGYPLSDMPADHTRSPRLHLIERGSAPTLHDLGGGYAPSLTYGDRLEGLVRELLAYAEEQDMTVYEAMIPGLIDRRADLRRRAADDETAHGPRRQLPLSEKRGVVIHYGGPPASQPGRFATAQAYAEYHVSRTWDSAGRVHGDGLMYHLAIGAGGEKWLCRDLEAVLWHCGVTEWNERALSIQMLVGGDQEPTEAAFRSLGEVLDAWRKATGTRQSEIWGHQELSSTSCPGGPIMRWLRAYREESDPVAEGEYFAQTKHYIGGAFYQHWRDHGGLMQFGYPLTDELDEECEDGETRTVQYFERAVFEFHPENPEPFRVLLRRVGALAAAEAGYEGPGIDAG